MRGITLFFFLGSNSLEEFENTGENNASLVRCNYQNEDGKRSMRHRESSYAVGRKLCMILHKIQIYLFTELDELLECSQGESGTAVVFHLSKEEAYVKFLQIRRVPLQERECSNNAPDIIPQIRSIAKKDRDVM
ncbi:uncharacterized protein [Spinacia oleracea]|uniref:Uncharacterized protein isoform X2 n=1 Tax=Spinacia oleracea TaxID=3562 RepID=A0ABM3RBN8_SPIOL|nr:uncharacterized protein LOC130460060 isoform X2 [Spinacia oleracea]XP_056693026.1 uncharacterized protein LOC110794226 isoform X2 [Spinacia oleracea]